MSYWENVFAMVGAACIAGYMLDEAHLIEALYAGYLSIVFGFVIHHKEGK